MGSTERKMEECRTQKRTVVLVPMPLQGHMTPMLQLGSVLYSEGFSIVVAHSEFRPPNPLNHPEFIFQPLLDNLSGHQASISNLLQLILAINSNCRALLEDYMVKLIEDQKQQGCQVACIIYDSLLFFVDTVATRLKIPGIILRPSLATYMLTYHHVSQLQAQGLIPFPESRLQEPVPGLHPLRFNDLPYKITAEIPEMLKEFMATQINIRSSVAIIWNTIDHLEHSALSLLQQRYKVPFFTIGPLHKMAAATSTSFLEEDKGCITWLEKHAPNSVLYVSLGSIACIDEKELTETAWGLANSGIPFLWVIRSDSINGYQLFEHFPEDSFKAFVGERGLIVKWAPQKEVLAHRAVGGFWSHCGWNSTLESICEGVPMICRPHFGDQQANARYLTCVWKVGLEMENVLDRGSIERTIRRLMVEKDGKEMRQRMLVFKDKLEAGLEKGGSSYESLKDLTDFITSYSAAAM